MSPARSHLPKDTAFGDMEAYPAARPAYPPVPPRALLLSATALAVPLLSQWYEPGFASEQMGILLWLPALVPAFLLTFYRGWRGASVALAAGMAVLAVSQAVVVSRGSDIPDWRVLLVLVVLLMAVSLGVGWVGELLHRARREAESMALTDPLTGLPNRRHLDVFMDAAFAAAERGGRMSVVLFDLDRFKRVNDAHGHTAGDHVLRVFGKILSSSTRRADLSCRFGGEEFVSVLTGADSSESILFVERVRSALANETFPWGTVTVSAGVASHMPGLASPDALLAEADRALYRAKDAGRDCVVTWQPEERAARDLVAVSALEGDAEEEEEHRAPARGNGRGRVLVVDDDVDTLGALARLVGRLGFKVDTAREGVAALARMHERAPDVVLADVVMPGMGGFTLADRIAREKPGLPVVLVSGYEHEGLAADRRPLSVIGFLKKPVEMRDLGVALEHAVAEARAAARRGRGAQ